jgi:hypothetical protein
MGSMVDVAQQGNRGGEAACREADRKGKTLTVTSCWLGGSRIWYVIFCAKLIRFMIVPAAFSSVRVVLSMVENEAEHQGMF